MNLQESITTWDEMLTVCLSGLREKYPSLTDGQVAEKLGMPRATFNRIKNEQRLPRLDNVIKLIIGSGNTTLLSNAIELHDKDLGKSLQGALSVALQEENKVLVNDELELVLEDRDVFVTYLLAGLPNGTDRIQLVEVLGNSGLEAIKTLLKKGLAAEVNGRYSLQKQGRLIRSFDSIKHHLNTYARFYKTEHVGKNRNYAHSMSEGLNKKGVKLVQEAHRRFHEELQRIHRDETNQGNIPSFSVAYCDTFTSIESEQNKEHLQ